jgi:hypothetical protein
MATITQTQYAQTEYRTKLDSKPDIRLFPDGIKTTGQQPPLYDQLRPYSDFPKQITGKTVWEREDYFGTSEKERKWKHQFTEEEIDELSIVADRFLASGWQLTGISKEHFPLSTLSKFLEELRDDLLNGKGFILFQGFPVKKWGIKKSAVAYMGLGTHLGYICSQNGKGHILGHVKDLGEDPRQWDRVRFYRTNARQDFHADPADIVGLLCISKALEGGELDVVSGHHVYNILQAERPDVIETLTKPIWYFDRKGETSVGQEEFIRTSVFYLEKGDGRVYSKWDPNFVKSLKRFSDRGIIPTLSAEQVEALQVLEDTCQRLSLHMKLDVGDVQFMNNEDLFHARTAYKDDTPPAPGRHLLRLWLATPESEGGWKLPFHDSDAKKRGGVQVDDRPPVALFNAE